MKSTQDTTPDVNEVPPAEVGADAVADVPAVPIEEIRRKYGPDIIRPASQLPPKPSQTQPEALAQLPGAPAVRQDCRIAVSGTKKDAQGPLQSG
jgi:hypothetical protein